MARKFVRTAGDVGVDGILVADLPPDEWENSYEKTRNEGLEIALLISPATGHRPAPLRRVHEIGSRVRPSHSRAATTGVQGDLPANLRNNSRDLRKSFPAVAVTVGFGMSTEERAVEVAAIADGVMIGSKPVHTIGTDGISAVGEAAREFAAKIPTFRTPANIFGDFEDGFIGKVL
jgi:tryptophan synthase alpha chain